MRIGIDLRCLEEEKISGVGEYALEIIRNLLETDSPRFGEAGGEAGEAGSENKYIIFSNSYKQKSKNFYFIKKYPHAELKRFRYPNKMLNLLLWYFGWPKLDKLIGPPRLSPRFSEAGGEAGEAGGEAGGVDIFFAPNINFLAVSKNCKLVTTFHDLSFERFPEFFTTKTRLWHYYFVNPRRIAKKSDRIIAVSQSTGNDLEKLYKINAKKISVIHHGISGDYQIISRNDPKLLAVQKKYNLPYKFILYLGNIEPRKNIESIIKAYKKLREENSALEKYKLVLAGNISPLCCDIIKKEKEDVLSIGYINREHKPFVYNLASLFVYPSFFEGFGLPILEAMACGTPVIASNNSSIPEVAGNAAILVDPNRPQEISKAMKNILSDEKLYEKLRERGITQAKKFSWKKCAEKTLEVFHDS